MLGKLIKHEFKASAHSVLNIYLAAAITIVIMLLSYAVKIRWISALSTVALLIISVLAVVITIIAVIAGFYKTLYGSQGYLSFTLPVKSGQLLGAKALVSFVWILLSYIICIGIFVGVYFYVSAKVGENTVENIKMLLQVFGGVSTKAIGQMIIFFVVSIIMQIAVLIAEIYFSITLANTRAFQKIGAVSAIFIFFGVFVLMQIVTAVLTTYVPVTLYYDPLAAGGGLALSFSQSMIQNPTGVNLGLTGLVFEIIAAAALFFTTGWLMKNKINVK